MTLPTSFVALRRRWLSLEPPINNARSNQESAPTYAIELALDHLVSRIHGHIADLMGRRHWNHRRFAEAGLATVDELERGLSDLPAGDTRALVKYLEHTRALLESLRDLAIPPSTSDYSSHAARDSLIATCQALVEGQINVLEAAAVIARLRFAVDPAQVDPDLLAFAGIESMEDHLTIVDTERGWPPGIRDAKLRERQDAEEYHREHALRSANRLLQRYGQSSP